MKNIHNIVQSHTNAQEGNILQKLMVVWLAQGPPFTRNVDVTKSFFFFFYAVHCCLGMDGTDVSYNSM